MGERTHVSKKTPCATLYANRKQIISFLGDSSSIWWQLCKKKSLVKFKNQRERGKENCVFKTWERIKRPCLSGNSIANEWVNPGVLAAGESHLRKITPTSAKAKQSQLSKINIYMLITDTAALFRIITWFLWSRTTYVVLFLCSAEIVENTAAFGKIFSRQLGKSSVSDFGF